MIRPLPRQQLATHLGIITGVLLLAIASEYSGFDLFWTGQFYDAAHHAWPYKKSFLTATLLHDAGKQFVVSLLVLNITAFAASFFPNRLQPHRKALAYLLLASITGPALVAFLKAHTHVYTPWKLQLFDSYRPYIRLFDPCPANQPVGHAFPGGHSSGGFAFLGLFVYAQAIAHPRRSLALAFPLLLGGLFGLTQQIRGAHFLSHDLVSLVICWASALGWFLVFYGLENRPVTAPAAAN